MLIFIFVCIIIALALIVASCRSYHVGNADICDCDIHSVASNTPEPDRIFSLFLQLGANDLRLILDDIIIRRNSAYEKFSSSMLADALGKVWRALAAFHVKPSVETMSGEERSEVLKWVEAAEENLCLWLDHMWKGGSFDDESDMWKRVFQAKVHVMYGRIFIARRDCAMRRIGEEIGDALPTATDIEINVQN